MRSEAEEAETSIENARRTFLTSPVWTETWKKSVTLDHHYQFLRARPTLALRMTLTSSPIQMTKMNFSRKLWSSLAYLTKTYPNEARPGWRFDVNSSRSPDPVAVRTSLFDLSDYITLVSVSKESFTGGCWTLARGLRLSRLELR